MQIRNDYHSQQGQAYTQQHTHHITECFHEEKTKKRQADAAGKTASYQKGDAAKAAVEYVASFSVETMSSNPKKIKQGLIKKFWESLGEEGEDHAAFDLKSALLNGIHGAATAVTNFWDRNMIRPAVTVRDKVKTMPAVAIRQFGKGKEAFGALLSGGMAFGGRKSKEKHRENTEPIKTKRPENHHLTDSYNKSGNYCQLHENLTYQKPKARTEYKTDSKG